MSQTSVSFTPSQAIAGLMHGTCVTRTGKNNESTLQMPFGIAVVLDTSASADIPGCKLPTASTDKFAGIVAFSYISPDLMGTLGPSAATLFQIMEEGMAWVLTEGAVTKGARPFVRFTANGGNTQLGKFRADADTDKAVEIKGGEYVTGTSGAGLALVKFSAAANRATQS